MFLRNSIIYLLLLRFFKRFFKCLFDEMDDSLDVSFENMQIQPYQFEPLVLGHSNSDENSSESDSASEEENGDVNIERIGQVDW